MTHILLYVSTFAVFLGLDFFGLTYIVKPVFERDIGGLLREQLKFWPALAFYAFFIFGVLWFVSIPAMADEKSLIWVFLSAALLGALAYGTYEFTNMATIKGWSWQMLATDLIWGTVLTGTSAVGGVVITRAFS